MIVKIEPTNFLNGKINLPASKSYSIRAFIIAACGGISQIIAPSNCDDAKVAKDVAKSLGARITCLKERIWLIESKRNIPQLSKVHVKESGTVLRFLLPLLPLYQQKASIVGKGTLIGRPNYHLTQTLREHGVQIRGQGKRESVPIIYKGGQICGQKIAIDGSLSSQFISAFLIACPLREENTFLKIKGSQVVSSDYITMTELVLKKSGIHIVRNKSREFFIKGNQRFTGLRKFIIPSDYGLAAFLLAAGAILKSKITLLGHLDDHWEQADGHVFSFLEKMGIEYKKTKKSVKMSGPFVFKGGVFSLKNCPDLVPIMSVLALFAKGRTRLCHIKHARAKESDRISDLRKELQKIGAQVTEKEDELAIAPLSFSNTIKYSDVLLDPHHDHRLSMAFSVLGMKLGLKIKDIECVSKSYPDFIHNCQQLGVKIIKQKRS